MCVCQCVALAGFAQGVEFRDISFAGALKAAKAENKTVFMDCYTSWCGPCKMMTNDIFPQEKVGKYLSPLYYTRDGGKKQPYFIFR